MKVIPVLDLQAGRVVHAVRGERWRYVPVQSRLVEGSSAAAVARALVQATGSDTVYVADLDALQGRPAQVQALHEVLAAAPDATVWLDAGFADAASALRVLAAVGAAAARVVPVFGTESLATAAVAAQALSAPGPAVLSLDHRGGRALDAAGCWRNPAGWPPHVIVMTLDRVGDAQGPDLETFGPVRSRAPAATAVIGAGGIRHRGDLAEAARAGAAAWLVATALHSGALG